MKARVGPHGSKEKVQNDAVASFVCQTAGNRKNNYSATVALYAFKISLANGLLAHMLVCERT